MNVINLYLIFISFQSGQHRNLAVSEKAEILDEIEKLYVSQFYDYYNDDLEFEEMCRSEIEKHKKAMQAAERDGKQDYHFELEDTTWATITFPKRD